MKYVMSNIIACDRTLQGFWGFFVSIESKNTERYGKEAQNRTVSYNTAWDLLNTRFTFLDTPIAHDAQDAEAIILKNFWPGNYHRVSRFF